MDGGTIRPDCQRLPQRRQRSGWAIQLQIAQAQEVPVVDSSLPANNLFQPTAGLLVAAVPHCLGGENQQSGDTRFGGSVRSLEDLLCISTGELRLIFPVEIRKGRPGFRVWKFRRIHLFEQPAGTLLEDAGIAVSGVDRITRGQEIRQSQVSLLVQRCQQGRFLNRRQLRNAAGGGIRQKPAARSQVGRPRCRPPYDAVIGESDMGHLGVAARHMASQTVVRGIFRSPLGFVQPASLDGMAAQAFPSVKRQGIARLLAGVRCVAGQTGHFLRPLITGALTQLGHVARYRHQLLAALEAILGAIVGQGLTGSEIAGVPATQFNGRGAAQVAGCTNRFQERARQLGGVDDGRVLFSLRETRPASQGLMQRARSVAVFATDCLLVKGDAMKRALDGLCTPRMAGHTIDRDGPIKTPMFGKIVPRRHVPLFAGSIPGDRRLVQEAVEFDQVGACEVSRADSVANRDIDAGDFLAVRRAQDLFMAELIVPTINAVGSPGKRVLEGAIGWLVVGIHLGERLAVRRKQVGAVIRRMTGDTGSGADVAGFRSSIEKAAFGVRRERKRIIRREVQGALPVRPESKDGRRAYEDDQQQKEPALFPGMIAHALRAGSVSDGEYAVAYASGSFRSLSDDLLYKFIGYHRRISSARRVAKSAPEVRAISRR